MNKKRSFHLTLSNPKQVGECLAFSLPQTNHYQTINNLKISSNNYEIINENKWGNKILVSTLNDVNDFNVSFQHTGKTINKTIDKKISDIIFPLYQQTLKKLTYGNPIDGLYSYQDVLKNPITDCGGFSTYLIHQLNLVNVKSRLVVGFIINNNKLIDLLSNFSLLTFNFKLLFMHAWLEALLPDNTWFPMDPSIEWRRLHGLSKRSGGFGIIPDDRLVVSFGNNFNFKINNKTYKIEILQKPVYIK